MFLKNLIFMKTQVILNEIQARRQDKSHWNDKN